MTSNSQVEIELYEEEVRDMNYSSRSVSPASCSGLSKEPIFTSDWNEEIETENLSTAASRFAMRSATELFGDKEPQLNTPAVVTLSAELLKI